MSWVESGLKGLQWDAHPRLPIALFSIIAPKFGSPAGTFPDEQNGCHS
jgi:hypothetical protein